MFNIVLIKRSGSTITFSADTPTRLRSEVKRIDGDSFYHDHGSDPIIWIYIGQVEFTRRGVKKPKPAYFNGPLDDWFKSPSGKEW